MTKILAPLRDRESYHVYETAGGMLYFRRIDQRPDGGFEQVHGGTTNEEVIEILIDRIRCLNAVLSCRENSLAITKLEEALLWLNRRTQLRTAQGVESTQHPHKDQAWQRKESTPSPG